MSQRLLREREKHLVDYGFHRNRSTVFLDAVLLRHTPAILNVMCYIGKQDMRLPIVLDGYYRYVGTRRVRPPCNRWQSTYLEDSSPEQLHTSREMCEVQRSDDWYQLAGAMIMDRRSTTATLDYLHLVRLYDRFSKCPFS
jgi:hypothetical protein